MSTAYDISERNLNRIPSRKDPRDKSTIFSIFPKLINEYKISVFPAHYQIAPGSWEKPSSLVIGTGSWWKDIPESNQLVEVTHNSLEMAESVINDYVIGLLAFTPEAKPGLFYVPEAIGVEEARKKYAADFDLALQRQKNWYLSLVNLADQIWSVQPNPAAIGNDMRLAAKELGLETKEWLNNYTVAAMSKCPACGTPRDTNYPVCSSCHMIVDPDKFKALGIQKPTEK